MWGGGAGCCGTAFAAEPTTVDRVLWERLRIGPGLAIGQLGPVPPKRIRGSGSDVQRLRVRRRG